MKKVPSTQSMNQNNMNKLDEQFIKVMLEVERNYGQFKKHEKIRIEQWSKKLCQVTINSAWKQNRNLYALLLLDCIQKGNLAEPFSKIPPEGNLVTLNKHIVKSRIGNLEERIEGLTAEIPPAQKETTPKKPTRQRSRSPSEEKRPRKENQTSSSLTGQFPKHLRSANYLPLERITTSEVNHYANQPFQYDQQSIKEPNSVREDNSRYGSRIMSPESVKSAYKKNDMKEILRLKAEVDLSKINEETLRNDINIKQIMIGQLNKKLDNMTEEIKTVEGQRNSLLAFFKTLRNRLDDGAIQFDSRNIEIEILKQVNELCAQFFLSPVNAVIKPIDLNHQVRLSNREVLQPRKVDTSNYESNKSGKSQTMVLTQTNNTQPNTHYQVDENSIEDIEQYLAKQFKGLPPMNETFNNKNTDKKFEDVKKKFQVADKDTAEFLNYLDNFQRENEKLKQETEKLLVRSSSYKTTKPLIQW